MNRPSAPSQKEQAANPASPQACGCGRKKIIEFGAQMAKNLNYQHQPDRFMPFSEQSPQKLISVIESIGGRVLVSLTTARDESPSLIVRKPKDFDIIILQYGHYCYGIAHELGHYLMHYTHQSRTDTMEVPHLGTPDTDAEANWFAMGFLLPDEKKLLEVAKSYGNDQSLMAAELAVPQRFLANRLKVIHPIGNAKKN